MSWKPINLATLGEREKVEPTLGGAGLVYPGGKRHVFSGPPESAKTLAAYAIAIAEASAGGTVILIDLEMGQWEARDRLRELGATDEDLARIHYVEPETPASDETMKALLELKPTLVVIDAAAGAYAVQDLDDMKRRDAEIFANLWVRPFWKANVSTIAIDHVVKNADNRGKFAIGSERKIGGVDVHIGFEAITELRRGGTGLYKLTTHRDRPGYLPRPRAGELEVHSDPTTHALKCTFNPPPAETPGEEWKPTILMDKVVAHLAEQTGPVTKTSIVETVRGNRGWLIKAIDQLVADGAATEDPGPRGAKLISLTRSAFPPVPGISPERPDRGTRSVSPLYRENGSDGTTQTRIKDTSP